MQSHVTGNLEFKRFVPCERYRCERLLVVSVIVIAEDCMHSAMTSADSLWSAAEDEGVEVCFANPGTTEMWLVDGLNRSPIRAVLGLHETVCSGAADGYGRLKRKPAVTLLHLGPGLANGLSNLHNARRASTPVVNLIGTMASWHETADPLLNMNVVALADTVSSFVRVTSSADSLVHDVRAACKATQTSKVAGGSRISTLIIPHDHTWHPETHIPSGDVSKNAYPHDVWDMTIAWPVAHDMKFLYEQKVTGTLACATCD